MAKASAAKRRKMNQRFRSTRSAGKSGKSKGSRSASVTDMQERAKAYFFDYNTVEMVLLGCAIFVCLSGIMFEVAALTDERISIPARSNHVVGFHRHFGSIIYYFIVFMSEVRGWESCAKYLQSRRKGLSAETLRETPEDNITGFELNPMHSRGHAQGG